MALKFGKPPDSAEVVGGKGYDLLHFPGEIRKAVLAGNVFGLYRTNWMLENQYQINNQLSVFGFGQDGSMKIGELVADADGVLQYHTIREPRSSDQRQLDIEFRRFWELLEQGCRLHPDMEYRFYG